MKLEGKDSARSRLVFDPGPAARVRLSGADPSRKEEFMKLARLARTAVLALGILVALPVFAGSVPSGQPAYRFLLSNDDGIDAPGLAALAEKLSTIGSVTVSASRDNRSGASHGVTSSAPIKVEESHRSGITWYAVDAFPATCVRLAIEALLPARPDIVVAGVNNGNALGVVSFFSSTVACAREAAITGLPAIAVHLEKSASMDYEGAADFILALVQEIKDKTLPRGVFLNVNIPALPKAQIRGVMITRQDLRSTLQFYEKKVDAAGALFFIPSYKHLEPGMEKTDIWAVRNGFIAITPLQIDQTASPELKPLESWAIMKWKSRRP
jgi:5'-nucleotidase